MSKKVVSKLLEKRLQKLYKATVEDYDVHSYRHIEVKDFKELGELAQKSNFPDAIRNVIYYSFQTLFDALALDSLNQEQRSLTFNLYENICSVATEFLTGYYLGEPDIESYRNYLAELMPQFAKARNVPFAIKNNKIIGVDDSYMAPNNVQNFLIRFVEHTLAGDIDMPEYIVGCACGAAELAFPLGGIFNVYVDHIRRSKTRGDSEVIVLPELQQHITFKAEGKVVACIEDVVSTGASLAGVMHKINSFGASSVYGVSESREAAAEYLKNTIATPSLRVYALN